MAISDSPQKTYLFTDFRDIRCSDLQWWAPDGSPLPLTNPPEPIVPAHATGPFMPRGIRLATRRANKMEPSPGPTNIMHDGGMYRSWNLEFEYDSGRTAQGWTDASPRQILVCYRESKDGFQWSEPTRSRFTMPGLTHFASSHVFIDPAGQPDQRYKMVYCTHPPEEQKAAIIKRYIQSVPYPYRDVRLRYDKVKGPIVACMYAAVSPDGFAWQPIPDPLMVNFADTDLNVYYDPIIRKYVLYMRLYHEERRTVARAESDDFYHWDPPVPIIRPSLHWAPTDDVYTSGRTGYPGLPQYHLMFPMIYHRLSQRTESHLYSSADGIGWRQVPGGPILEPGPSGSWDSEMCSVHRPLVPLGPQRVGMRYGGNPWPHKYPRWPHRPMPKLTKGWCWWPQGRICGLTADDEGEFTTFPMVPAGRQLRLNVSTKRAGWIRVEVLAVSGLAEEQFDIMTGVNTVGATAVSKRSLADCDPIVGDHLAEPVHWNGNTDIAVRQTDGVTLRFSMREAEIYGFEWV